jgi:hypothetical protein
MGLHRVLQRVTLINLDPDPASGNMSKEFASERITLFWRGDVSDSDLTRSRIPNVNLFPAEHLGTTGLVKANGFCHWILRVLWRAGKTHLTLLRMQYAVVQVYAGSVQIAVQAGSIFDLGPSC